MFYGNTGFLGFCTILSHFGVKRFCMYCTRNRLWKVNKEILRVDANWVYKWMIQSVEFSVFYSDYHCTKFSHRWEQVLKYLPGRPELHARRINMFTRFSFYQAGRIFDAKSDTMGLKNMQVLNSLAGRVRDHWTINFVPPGRPDIWRKYITGYEIIKIFKFHFIKENRIFDAKKKVT